MHYKSLLIICHKKIYLNAKSFVTNRFTCKTCLVKLNIYEEI